MGTGSSDGMVEHGDGPILLSLDLGTTNCKAVAYDGSGAALATHQQSYRTRSLHPGWYEQQPAEWIRAATSTIRSVSDALGLQVGRVTGLALSVWGPSLVFLSEDGTAISRWAPTWQDSRSASYGERLLRDVGSDWIGGGIPTTGFPAKLAWALAETPAVARRAAYATGAKEVILAWLTGVIATEPSSGPFASAWPKAVFEHIGWSIERLPHLLRSTDVAGGLRADRAAELGLPAGLPVVMGLNDGGCAMLGSGAVAPGDAAISLGTNGVLRVLVRTRPSSEDCLNHGLFRYPLLEGLWCTGGFVLAGGEALDWLTRAISSRRGRRTYERLLGDAEHVGPGSDGLVFLPYLVGRGSPHPIPGARGAFVGLDLRHRRGHLVRAVLEGVGFGLREIAATLTELGWTPRRIAVTGGGARSELWRRCLAGVFGREVEYAEGSSSLGAAVLLAVAIGLYPNLEEAARRMVPLSMATHPEPGASAIYADRYAAFRRATDLLAPTDATVRHAPAV